MQTGYFACIYDRSGLWLPHLQHPQIQYLKQYIDARQPLMHKLPLTIGVFRLNRGSLVSRASISTLTVSTFYMIPQMVGAAALFGTLLGAKDPYAVQRFEELEVRANTGLGSERATAALVLSTVRRRRNFISPPPSEI